MRVHRVEQLALDAAMPDAVRLALVFHDPLPWRAARPESVMAIAPVSYDSRASPASQRSRPNRPNGLLTQPPSSDSVSSTRMCAGVSLIGPAPRCRAAPG